MPPSHSLLAFLPPPALIHKHSRESNGAHPDGTSPVYNSPLTRIRVQLQPLLDAISTTFPTVSSAFEDPDRLSTKLLQRTSSVGTLMQLYFFAAHKQIIRTKLTPNVTAEAPTLVQGLKLDSTLDGKDRLPKGSVLATIPSGHFLVANDPAWNEGKEPGIVAARQILREEYAAGLETWQQELTDLFFQVCCFALYLRPPYLTDPL